MNQGRKKIDTGTTSAGNTVLRDQVGMFHHARRRAQHRLLKQQPRQHSAEQIHRVVLRGRLPAGASLSGRPERRRYSSPAEPADAPRPTSSPRPIPHSAAESRAAPVARAARAVPPGCGGSVRSRNAVHDKSVNCSCALCPCPIGVLAVLPHPGSAAELFGWDKLTYGVEWRLVRSGTVVIEPNPANGRVHLESAGLLSALFKVEDTYQVHYDGNYCALNSTFDSVEGKASPPDHGHVRSRPAPRDLGSTRSRQQHDHA